jgi:ABC-type uncharacterized transport system involved in gliding motility auxiliary subunit
MLAWISNHYTIEFDLTANQRHSLSGNSINLLNSLDKSVTVHAYTTDAVTKKAITEIISRYQKIKSDFYVQVLNPDIDIEQAQQDGIVMNQPFAFVIYYNNRMEHITSLSEQAISNALLRLNRRDNQQVVFLSGHGERDLYADDNRAYSELSQQLKQMGFNLQSINLLQNPLPENTKLVVIAAPDHAYLSGEIVHIENFITSGGNLLWLVDPGETQGLEQLATSFGLQLQEGIIVDNNVELRRTLNIQHAAIIPVSDYFPHLITNTMRYHTLFAFARGISPLKNNSRENNIRKNKNKDIGNWQAVALFNSFSQSWSETGGLTEEMVFDSSTGDIAGPMTIAVALHRWNEQQAKNQRIVVIGDSDFLSNNYIGSGANLNLGLNIFNWLIGDDDFISIEVKPSPDTKLVLNDTQLMIIAFGFFLVIPLLLLIIGFAFWYKRKRQ